MNNKNPILEVNNLQMHFPIKKRGGKKGVIKAIDDVSFKVYEGETFGLVGESGCGKTTTGRSIIRLYDPTDGKIYFKGKDITGVRNKELKEFISSNMAMIFQDPVESLNPRMTIEEIVGEGLEVKGIKDPEERKNMVYEMLDRVGLTKEHAHRYPHEFSGGQRQRIGIARALIIKPTFIIADEPVSALDVSIQAQVINLLNDLREEFGLTILFIAHDLAVVKYFTDRIAVMYYGKIVELADSNDLFKNPIHPYTKSLLSAIPQPNPITERKRKRIPYNPEKEHDYSIEKPTLREIHKDHFVYCSESEFQKYKKQLGI